MSVDGARGDAKWTFAGVFYCTVHAGILNEDDVVCDFRRDDGHPCVRLPLYFGEPVLA